MMDREDEEALREILVAWYQAQNWSMSKSLLDVVIKMLDEMHTCTNVMHFVPGLVGPANSLAKLAKSYIKKILKVAKDNSQVYLSCARATILRYKTDIHLASQGL
jgi:hypothetical protein